MYFKISANEKGLALWLHSAFGQASNKSIIKKQKFMFKKKDELRSVELDQNLNSTTKADDTTSISHNAKPNVGGCGSLKPILFSTEMVNAILNGSKSQTRRIVKSKSPIVSFEGILEDKSFWKPEFIGNYLFDLKEGGLSVKPKYKVGDILWVRETWSFNPFFEIIENNEEFLYKATDKPFDCHKWKPSLFMPFDACRIFLKVINVSVERLNDISEQDAINEGIKIIHNAETNLPVYKNYLIKENLGTLNPVRSYSTLWEKINGNNSWNENPFVWVIEFERCHKP